MPFQTVIGKLFYRVGDVIISTSSENPSKQYGGTWELFAPGRTLVCIDTSDLDFNSIKKTGGEKKHTLSVSEMPSHTHTQNAHGHSGSTAGAGAHGHTASSSSAGAHRHNVGSDKDGANGTARYTVHQRTDDSNTNAQYHARTSSDGSHTHTITINSVGDHTHSITVNANTASNQNTGGGTAHNNLQPYIVVYMWIRVS